MDKELRFDIVEAWYIWLCTHHNGKGAHRGDSDWWRSYANLSTIEDRFHFKPAANLSYETLTERGQEIHDNLCRRCGFCDCLENEHGEGQQGREEARPSTH